MIEKIANEIQSRTASAKERNLLVGISGIDGSGKSTFAEKLKEYLSKTALPTVYVDLDDFLQPRHIRHKNDDQVKSYYEDNFDYLSLVNDLIVPALQSSQFRTHLPKLDLDTDQIERRCLEFSGPGVVILEGVFLFRKELREYFDLKVWLEIDFDTAMSRVLNRTRDKRYGSADAIYARYQERFYPTQRFHMERDDPVGCADLIIDAFSD
ncbi:MAG: AAA family ATPase [Litoreibacter sp.]